MTTNQHDDVDALCARAGVTRAQLDDYAALDIVDAWRSLDDQDGTNHAEEDGISGSDIAGYLAELDADQISDLISRRSQAPRP